MHQVVIVRRGETARLSLLRETFIAATAVIWDRRFVDRRQHPERRVPDRRRHDRRGQPPRSWTDLGFLIFEIPVGSQFRVGGSGSVHSLHPIEGDVLMVREVHAGVRARSAGFPSRPVPSSPRTASPSSTPFSSSRQAA